MLADFDALVVGAGPAGTAAAFALHQAGHRTLLVDRSTFPRQKPCGGGLTIKSLKLLPWSVGPVIETATKRLHIGVTQGGRERGAVFQTEHPVCAFAVRSAFDAYNLVKVLDSGVAFEKVPALSAVDEREDHVRVSFGKRVITARYLVGADGANSMVRRLTSGAPWFHRGFAIEGLVENADIARPPIPEFLFGQVRNGYGWLFPKRDHVNAGIFAWDNGVTLAKDQLRSYVRDRLGSDRVRAVVGFPIGFGGRDAVQDRDRILLAGDAGGFAEPVLGEGIHNAIKSGQAAALAIDDVEARRAASLRLAYDHTIRPIREDLATYERAKRLFYARLHTIGYRLLRFPVVRSAMMRGFASGMTLHEITHPPLLRLMFLASPFFRRIAPPPLELALGDQGHPG